MIKKLRNLFIAVTLFAAGAANAQIVITTYAGTGSSGGYIGDGGPATVALLSSPSDVAVDKAGNVYVADFVNNVIRKVDTFGVITNFAGTGLGSGGAPASGGYSGDNGPATAADLNGPFALAIDKNNNVYFADGYNHVVRKVNTAGIITTVAGNHIAGYSGDGGPATAAAMNNPVGLAIDTTGNLYIADDHNNVIRKVGTDGMISTFAGDSTAGYAGSGGAATSALLDLPLGVAVDKAGNVYIADAMNNMVRKVSTTGILTDYVGSADTAHGDIGDGGAALTAKLYYPTHLAFDNDDNLYIADAYNNKVRKVTPAGIITTFAGTGNNDYTGDDGPATSADMYYPHGVAVNQNGIIYIADRGNQVIRRVGPAVLPPNSVHAANNAATGLNVYPNPTRNGMVTLNVATAVQEEAQVVITNILGATVQHLELSTNKPTMINKILTPGIYMLSATTVHGSWSRQLVVE